MLSPCPVKEKSQKTLASAIFFIYSVDKWVKVGFFGGTLIAIYAHLHKAIVSRFLSMFPFFIETVFF